MTSALAVVAAYALVFTGGFCWVGSHAAFRDDPDSKANPALFAVGLLLFILGVSLAVAQ